MIDYANELNQAQLEATTTLEGPVLVIAGAGSGKTRTIVYRLARLVESGVSPASILLLTFTRKAAREMIERAQHLLGRSGGIADAHGSLAAVQGGTFHAFAYSILRLFRPEGFTREATVMDASDMTAALQHCKEELALGKGDHSFPKIQTVHGFISKSRNRETPLETLLAREAQHLLPHAGSLQRMADAYAAFKREKALLDYDDLLFELENVLRTRQDALAYCWKRYRYIMIDEYQDTNPVQARIGALLAGADRGAFAEPPDESRGAAPAPRQGAEPLGTPINGGPGNSQFRRTAELDGGTEATPPEGRGPGRSESIPWQGVRGTESPALPGGSGNIMIVGDDAQSIYAFRGADVRNILRFPDMFPGCRVIRLEENYRSTQPVLDLTNAILESAPEGYKKHLFTRKEGGDLPQVIRPLSDLTQAGIVARRVVELTGRYAPAEIAVLFRAGYQSYHLEVQLNKLGIRFAKYGGIRYAEAAHVKDAMSFVRLICNPLDFTAFQRMAALTRGIGAKTCLKLYRAVQTGDAKTLDKARAKFPTLSADLAFLDAARLRRPAPAALLEDVIIHYTPRLQELYPDDYPRRMQGLEQLVQVAAVYDELDLFIADLSLEDPLAVEEAREYVTLSTIHSAKGLEWSAVLILDLVEERFPSRHAMTRNEDFEEERRLMYVAATRAKEYLGLCVPAALYARGEGGTSPAVPSPFVRAISPTLYEEWQEGFGGHLARRGYGSLPGDAVPRTPSQGAQPLGTRIGAGGGPGNSGTWNGAGHRGHEKFTPSPHNAGQGGSAPLRGAGGAEPPVAPAPVISPLEPGKSGYCTHKIFGRGKIVQHLPPDKYRVNFPGVGLKVIMGAYLQMED